MEKSLRFYDNAVFEFPPISYDLIQYIQQLLVVKYKHKMNISLQLLDINYFTIYCNDKYETIIYYNKYIIAINCLLQQHIYHCMKVVIKIFSDYCNEIFCCTSSITSKFIATTRINYCNDSNVIAMIFCCCNKHFFLVVLRAVSKVYLMEQKKRNYLAQRQRWTLP